MDLSEKLYELRKNNNWSQEELAERMEVSRQTVSKWESGNAIPELNKLVKLSEIYKITLDELVKETTADENLDNLNQGNGKKKKFIKRILIIILLIVVFLGILFTINIFRRMKIVYDISDKYKINFESIGETRSGSIREKITKRDINTIEETDKEYLYYVSENGEKFLKITSYKVEEDNTFANTPIEEIYIDLTKEIPDTLRHYTDVTKINLIDGSREVVTDYELDSPIVKATMSMNNYYSIICAYDKVFSDKEISFDFKNKLFGKDENYAWSNDSINNSKDNIGVVFGKDVFYMYFDNYYEDIKEKREIIDIQMLNWVNPTKEEMLPPEI